MSMEDVVEKVILTDFGQIDVISSPIRCKHIIYIICLEGEAEVDINYVTYKVERNSVLTLAPLDIATLKSRSDDFSGKVLLLPHTLFAPIIMSLDISFFKDIQRRPVVNFNGKFLEMVLKLFSLLENAKELLSYDDFKAFTEKIVLSLFVLQKGILKNIKEPQSAQPSIDVRKNELFRKFIVEIVASHTKSREVLYYANELGMSSGYLNEICNYVSNHSAKEIIDSAVVTRLKYELSYTAKSIQEITDEYNFPSQSYFSRYFKRITGVTPSCFRKSRTDENKQ